MSATIVKVLATLLALRLFWSAYKVPTNSSLRLLAAGALAVLALAGCEFVRADGTVCPHHNWFQCTDGGGK